MTTNYLKGIAVIAAIVLSTGISVSAAENENVRQVSGEIGWVDVQLGKLELNKETPSGTRTTTYNITQNETRVTDPRDEKFLNVQDLRAGQNVSIDVLDDQSDKPVTRIVVEPMSVSEYQQSFGVVKALDVAAGTLAVEERVRIGQTEEIRQANFVFDPKTIVALRSPSKQPVELVLKPGDVVKVDYVTTDGKQYARYITLYSPAVTSTVTTTTVTTTQ